LGEAVWQLISRRGEDLRLQIQQVLYAQETVLSGFPRFEKDQTALPGTISKESYESVERLINELPAVDSCSPHHNSNELPETNPFKFGRSGITREIGCPCRKAAQRLIRRILQGGGIPLYSNALGLVSRGFGGNLKILKEANSYLHPWCLLITLMSLVRTLPMYPRCHAS